MTATIKTAIDNKINQLGKSRITDEEWKRLCEGYKTITGEDYVI